MKKYFITTLITFLVVLFSVQHIAAQGGVGGGGGGTITITGSSSAYQNETKSYTATPSPVLTIYSASWSVTSGGTIQSQNTTSASILWTTTGTKTITYTASFTNQGLKQEIYSVTVFAVTAPPTPATPIIASQNCTSATLQKRGNPPSGISCYWQGTNSNGTSTASNATSNYNVSSSGTYYIRARNNSSGTWSASSASVAVTLGTVGGPTWYADYDGDG